MELEACGHAGHGAIGHDIVCAGVSALLYGLAAYLTEQAEACPAGQLEISETAGRLYIRTRGVTGDESAFALTAAGLRLIERGYPEAVCLVYPTDVPCMKGEEYGRTVEGILDGRNIRRG